ncbi:MAG: hypothetical protein FD180_1654 [Planctomycetota bacterium]|nr:MAG: hypothetical protein FD180_1654 [Planctomycetota bacterium]
MANFLRVINPYKTDGTWVFDDPVASLVQEPFVSGIPEMIERLTAGIPGAEKGFRMLFAPGPFPGAMAELSWVREDMGGNWYRWTQASMEGWLCPALFKYFDKAPEKLFVRVESRAGVPESR